jgi:hypothetical protein
MYVISYSISPENRHDVFHMSRHQESLSVAESAFSLLMNISDASPLVPVEQGQLEQMFEAAKAKAGRVQLALIDSKSSVLPRTLEFILSRKIAMIS